MTYSKLEFLARVILSSKARSSSPQAGAALPDHSHNGTMSPPVTVEPKPDPGTFSETTPKSLTEIAFEDANLVHMSDGQPLPSDRDQGHSSQNMNLHEAAAHDANQDASTLENTGSTTVVPDLVEDDLNSVDKLALVSSVALLLKLLLTPNRTVQKLWNVRYLWKTSQHVPQRLGSIVSQWQALRTWNRISPFRLQPPPGRRKYQSQ